MKRESKPHYLQDTILPKEFEKPHKSWNLDREFGPGTQERILTAITARIKERLANNEDLDAAFDATTYCILTGQNPVTLKELKRIKDSLKGEFRSEFNGADYLNASWNTVQHYILTGQHLATPEEIGLLSASLKDRFRKELDVDNKRTASWRAADYRILTGQQLGTPQERERLVTFYRDQFLRFQDDTLDPTDVDWWPLANLRLLRAHDIKFTPGKGIEIIDDPPEAFEKKVEPIPEERKF